MGFMGKMDTYRYTTLPFYYALPFTVEPFGVCARTQKTRDLAEKLGRAITVLCEIVLRKRGKRAERGGCTEKGKAFL